MLVFATVEPGSLWTTISAMCAVLEFVFPLALVYEYNVEDYNGFAADADVGGSGNSSACHYTLCLLPKAKYAYNINDNKIMLQILK